MVLDYPHPPPYGATDAAGITPVQEQLPAQHDGAHGIGCGTDVAAVGGLPRLPGLHVDGQGARVQLVAQPQDTLANEHGADGPHRAYHEDDAKDTNDRENDCL